MAGAGLGADGGDGGGRQADGVCVAGGEPQAGAQRVTGIVVEVVVVVEK